MIFDNPKALSLLAGAPLILILYWMLSRFRKKAMQKIDAHSSLLEGPSNLLSASRVALLIFAWIGAVVALMQPKGNPHQLPETAQNEIKEQVVGDSSQAAPSEDKTVVVKRRKAHEVIFLLDVSASMRVNDCRSGQTRFDLAKEIIDETLSLLDGQATALYAFTSELVPLIPSSVDYLYSRLFLRNIGINEGDSAGTDLAEALEAIYRHYSEGGKQKNRTLILLTDGGDTRLDNLSKEEREKQLSAILSRLEHEKVIPWTLQCIGLGSHEGKEIPGIKFNDQPVHSTLDEDLLQRMSSTGGGNYYFANHYSSLALAQEIVKEIKKQDQFIEDEEEHLIDEMREQTVVRENKNGWLYDHYFQISLLVAILFLSSELLLPGISRRSRT